jgi:beta-galactosidase
VFCPLAENLVTCKIEAPAKIAGVCNGNQLSLEPFQANQRHLFYGKAMLIVHTLPGTAGTIRITASSNVIKPATVILQSRLSMK